jgi:hypothetical protein
MASCLAIRYVCFGARLMSAVSLLTSQLCGACCPPHNFGVRSLLKRLSISLFGLPLMAMFAFSLFTCVGPEGCTTSEWIAASMVIPGVGVILFMPVALLLAITLWLLLRFRLTAAWHFLLSGAIVGSVCVLPFVWRALVDSRLGWDDRLAQLGWAWGPSATTSAVMGVFWLVAIWRNQDFAR